MIVEDRGVALVEKYLAQIVDYYAESADADNHAVREAACHCIAEMVKKVRHEALEPYVPRLLDTLMKCFKDESWPVRDTACVACGSFIHQFPDRCRDFFASCKPLFLENLGDPIISVRHGGAIALGNCVRAYGKEDVLDRFLMPYIKEALAGISAQPSETLKYSSELSSFGVAEKKIRDNDYDLHENQVMYSCGSLAPKMSRGGGCSDEPWERADGCIHLLAELSSICPQETVPLLPGIAEASRHRHYANHFVFIESILRRLFEIAQNITKKRFKPLLEDFLEPIFYALKSDNLLASSSAEACICDLSHFLGANIFKGRVEQFNPSYLESLARLPLDGPLPRVLKGLHLVEKAVMQQIRAMYIWEELPRSTK
ncbi:Putative LOC100889564 [Caligus rogercresseyi]|uniref:LOC100889564 n=1 Tax=Caligus rogercresseyi TaxID=217165 RepID=A0A7T8GMQ1_CALRO|nr:Putative LOC100889564 [Caligus rogercresseyi]QQP33014.1 Putative LOC100889564 [Caligus rogercresseyi]